MCIDVVDGARFQAGGRECSAHGQTGADGFGVWRRHVMRVHALAIAQQFNGMAVGISFQQKEGASLADRHAGASGVERPARGGREQFQRVEAVKRGPA